MLNSIHPSMGSPAENRAGSSPPDARTFGQRILKQEGINPDPKAGTFRSSPFSTINKAFVERRIWRFRRQEIWVTLFEVAFVGTCVWMLFRNFG
ncbi:MAG: hypothetical protein GC205_04840 [Bacteroidetes bacterium]|nr:hypothetical protein [Bacteroidota bacterium]